MRCVVLCCALLAPAPACSLLAPHSPPPAVASEADLATLNAKVDDLAAHLRSTGVAALSGNVPAAAGEAITTGGGIAALAREYSTPIGEVLAAVFLSLAGVRYWRGSIKKRRGAAPGAAP